MNGFIGGIITATGMVMIALLTGYLARMVRLHQIEPNGVIGLRTKATRSSSQAWQRGHDAARPLLVAACITAVATAVLFAAVGVVSGAADAGDAVPAWLAAGGYAVVLALAVAAGVVADREARHVMTGRPDRDST